MKTYRILHIPTGLFYRPNSNHYGKNNLSETGKIYTRKPNIKQISGFIYVSKTLNHKYKIGAIECKHFKQSLELHTNQSDWEIKESELN